MEDLKAPEVQAWFKAQNDYTRAVLARVPGRTALLARIKELDAGAPAGIGYAHVLPGGRAFSTKRLASEEVTRLYVREGWNGAEKLLLDPTRFEKPGGPHYSISYVVPSLDGRYV